METKPQKYGEIVGDQSDDMFKAMKLHDVHGFSWFHRVFLPKCPRLKLTPSTHQPCLPVLLLIRQGLLAVALRLLASVGTATTGYQWTHG